MGVRSKGQRHNFQTNGKTGRAGAKRANARLERHDNRTEDRLSIEDEIYLEVTGHLPEDF